MPDIDYLPTFVPYGCKYFYNIDPCSNCWRPLFNQVIRYYIQTNMFGFPKGLRVTSDQKKIQKLKTLQFEKPKAPRLASDQKVALHEMLLEFDCRGLFYEKMPY